MTIVALFDIAFLATLPGRTMEPAAMDRHGTVRSGSIVLYDRSPFAHSICVQPHEGKRKPFTVGLVRVCTMPRKATLELCDRLSNPLIEVDAVVHKNLPLDCVCDLGYGIAPGTRPGGGPCAYPITMCCGLVSPRRTRCGPQWRTTRGSRRSRKRGVRRVYPARLRRICERRKTKDERSDR